MALAWLGAAGLVLVVRRLVQAGIYHARIEGYRVTIVSGLWSSSFASLLTLLACVVAVATVSWLTYSWLAGSGDRRRMATMTHDPQRKPLM